MQSRKMPPKVPLTPDQKRIRVGFSSFISSLHNEIVYNEAGKLTSRLRRIQIMVITFPVLMASSREEELTLASCSAIFSH